MVPRIGIEMKHTLAALGAAAALAAIALLPRPARAEDTTAAAPATVVPAGDYRLGIGDKLRIEVYKDAQLSQSVQVRPDGKITLPLIGDIQAASVTPLELRQAI